MEVHQPYQFTLSQNILRRLFGIKALYDIHLYMLTSITRFLSILRREITFSFLEIICGISLVFGPHGFVVRLLFYAHAFEVNI